jgi:PAS domain-containing protein
MREAILLVDDAFQIVEANPRAAELFAYTVEELKRKQPGFPCRPLVLRAGHS